MNCEKMNSEETNSFCDKMTVGCDHPTFKSCGAGCQSLVAECQETIMKCVSHLSADVLECMECQSLKSKLHALTMMRADGIVSQEQYASAKLKIECLLKDRSSKGCYVTTARCHHVVLYNPHATVEGLLPTVNDIFRTSCSNPFEAVAEEPSPSDLCLSCLDDHGERVAGDSCRFLFGYVVAWFDAIFNAEQPPVEPARAVSMSHVGPVRAVSMSLSEKPSMASDTLPEVHVSKAPEPVKSPAPAPAKARRLSLRW